jgi:heme exporter protein CcmD
MGGYAGFVWGSYIAAGLCITLEVVLLTARHRRLRRELRNEVL